MSGGKKAKNVWDERWGEREKREQGAEFYYEKWKTLFQYIGEKHPVVIEGYMMHLCEREIGDGKD